LNNRAKQEEVQTHGAIFGGFFGSKTRVKCDYNEINRSTHFIYGAAGVFTEGDWRHFGPLLLYSQQQNVYK